MEFKEHFIDSLGYEIELSSRVCHETFKRWFEKNIKSVTHYKYYVSPIQYIEQESILTVYYSPIKDYECVHVCFFII